MTTPDPWHLYRTSRDAVIERLRSRSVDEIEVTVPLTPAWTVLDVVRHLCGLCAAVAGGGRTNLGTPERTAAQVSDRRHLGRDEIFAEWVGHGEAMHAAMAEDAFLGHRLAADLTVHAVDIAHALGIEPDRAGVAVVDAAHTYARVVSPLVAERCGVRLTFELTDGTTWTPPDGEGPGVVLRATPYDMLRSVTARRSRREVAALDWDGDPSAVLDVLSPYGPLRADDAGI